MTNSPFTANRLATINQYQRQRVPLNFFANQLTVAELDCLCCEKGTVAGISPSNYYLYTQSYQSGIQPYSTGTYMTSIYPCPNSQLGGVGNPCSGL